MKASSSLQIGTYANVLLDDWFKRTFGNESRKRLTILMLQLLIPDHHIESISFAPQEHVNPFNEKKDIRVDVECTDSDGSRFIVEMQVAPQDDFYERAIYNSSFGIQQQIPEGQRPYGFKPVYFIGFLRFGLHGAGSKLLYRYRLREDQSLEVMSDNIQFLFIELPNGAKTADKATSLIDRFCYSLLNMKDMDCIPKGWDQDEIIRLLFDSANISKFTPQERVKYINDMTTQRDFENQLVYAAERGMEKGIEKAKLEDARNFKRLGVSEDIIRQATGLTPETIASL